VMNDIIPPECAVAARRFRALSATYEANRDLVMMGAYRQGADPLLDEAIALHPRMSAFLSQGWAERIDVATAFAQMTELVGNGA